MLREFLTVIEFLTENVTKMVFLKNNFFYMNNSMVNIISKPLKFQLSTALVSVLLTIIQTLNAGRVCMWLFYYFWWPHSHIDSRKMVIWW